MPHRKHLQISGTALFLALDVLAFLDPHYDGHHRHNPHGFSEKKVQQFLTKLLGDQRNYFSIGSVYDGLYQIRKFLRAITEPALGEIHADILPLLLSSHGPDQLAENPFHRAELKYFLAFAESDISEAQLR